MPDTRVNCTRPNRQHESTGSFRDASVRKFGETTARRRFVLFFRYFLKPAASGAVSEAACNIRACGGCVGGSESSTAV
jgi:hypothetical protein